MVHEQVHKMITNVSGLYSHKTDITCCTHEMNMHIDASLHVLCTNQTPQRITRAALEYDTENKGIPLSLSLSLSLFLSLSLCKALES